MKISKLALIALIVAPITTLTSSAIQSFMRELTIVTDSKVEKLCFDYNAPYKTFFKTIQDRSTFAIARLTADGKDLSKENNYRQWITSLNPSPCQVVTAKYTATLVTPGPNQSYLSDTKNRYMKYAGAAIAAIAIYKTWPKITSWLYKAAKFATNT